jgi:recombination protein U
MAYWNTRGLRGSTLEELINITNDVYKQKGLAIIQKIPTPIKPVQIDQKNRTITLAYFEQVSTVDYIGVAQGIAISFDAKETSQKSLPIQNIHAHQIAFMDEFQKQKGVAFLLVHFVEYDEYYYLPFEVLKRYWDDSQNAGRKSIPYSAFDKQYLIKSKSGAILNYLESINIYLKNQQNS